MNSKDLLATITHEVDAVLETSEDGGMPHEAFLEWCIGELAEIGEIEDVTLSNFDKVGQAVHGYSYSDDDGRLDLFVTLYRRSQVEYTASKGDLETSIKRLRSFVEKSKLGKNNDLSIHDPASGLVEVITKVDISQLRLFVFTDGNSNITKVEQEDLCGLPTRTYIWDLPRFLRSIVSGREKEETDVFVEEFGAKHITCSSASTPDDDISTYLCVLPGDFLADLYLKYTSRLLERNVRAFLSFKGPVNKGILQTIEEEPHKFIAYNNGLTATASRIEINDENTKITKIYDFQIVNGGQTTNSIYRAKYSNKMDVSKVFVPLKLCVLSKDDMDEFGPRIAKFSNKQNAVKDTDFSSSNPIYIAMEQQSRNVYAPAPDGLQTETKWYFERFRGQYADDLANERTPAAKKKFERIYPRAQKLDKSLLAKYWGVWYQQVLDVSLGPEKYHPKFIEDSLNNKNKFDLNKSTASFQKLVAMAILYKDAYKRIRSEKYGYTYPGNTTDYTVALISNLSLMRLDLISVWNDQKAPEAFMLNVDFLAPIVGDLIHEITNKTGYIPNELAKGRKVNGKTLWELLLEQNLALRHEMQSGETEGIEVPLGGGRAPLSPAQEEALGAIKDISAENLFQLTSWAKETNNLLPWQRGIMFSVAQLLGRGKTPSGKQMVQTVKAIEEAKKLGYKEI